MGDGGHGVPGRATRAGRSREQEQQGAGAAGLGAAGSQRAEVTDKPAGLAAGSIAGDQRPLPGALVTRA